MSIRRMHALSLAVEFPAGLAAGEGRERNILSVARDGADRPVLRGSSLAGALRHAYERDHDDASQFFGLSLTESQHLEAPGEPSTLCVPDIPLRAAAVPGIRHHNRIARHSGRVADKALFSLEACPPGTTAEIVLWMSGSEQPEAEFEFLTTIAGLVAGGLKVGGNTARGIGRMELSSPARLKTFEFGGVEGYAEYLDAHQCWRADGTSPGGTELEPRAEEGVLEVSFTLTIPRGQDLLVGDGQGLDFEIEPQMVTDADGEDCWRLPGSSLRGVFRDWITRLAVREGEAAFDAPKELGPRALEDISGDEIGKAGVTGADEVRCPVSRLFGTLHQAGRLHIADSVCRQREEQAQLRTHVAVDRVTGGARDGALFSNQVLTCPPDRPVEFAVRVRVEQPDEREARWLATTLKALDLGLIRVGSSKAAGCLCLTRAPEASGPHHELFNSIEPTRKER